MKIKSLFAGLIISAVMLSSCAGVKLDYNSTDYLKQQLSEIPAELLNSKLVQNEAGQAIVDPPLSVGEFLIFMMSSQPMEQNSWFNMNVAAKEDGSIITIKKYTRGNMVLVNKLYTTYQKGFAESRVDKILWDDRRTGEKLEFTSPEDKLGYSLLITALFVLQ